MSPCIFYPLAIHNSVSLVVIFKIRTGSIMTSETMNAIVVKKYGEISQLISQTVPKPGPPEGQDLLVRYVNMCSYVLQLFP